MIKKSFLCNNINELDEIACRISEFADKNKFFAITGNMGVGKTTFIKKICKLIGVDTNVSSPTFSLINEYLNNKGEKIYHFDFYRIKNISEVYDIGYEDYFFSGNYCFIEWPEKIKELLPNEFLLINIIENFDGSRTFECSFSDKNILN